MTGRNANRNALYRTMQGGPLVLPGAVSIGDLRAIERNGFNAVSTTIVGLSASLARPEASLSSRSDVLSSVRMLCQSTSLPVEADFGGGFSDDLKGLAESATLVVGEGASGLSITDRDIDRLRDLETSMSRLSIIRAALDRLDRNVILVGRSDGFLIGQTNIEATITRLSAYSDAGADALYAPGVTNAEDIAKLVQAIAPKPFQVLLNRSHMRADALTKLGVRRLATGGSLVASASIAFATAAKSLAEECRLAAISVGRRQTAHAIRNTLLQLETKP